MFKSITYIKKDNWLWMFPPDYLIKQYRFPFTFLYLNWRGNYRGNGGEYYWTTDPTSNHIVRFDTKEEAEKTIKEISNFEF